MLPDDPALPALVAAREHGLEWVLSECGVIAAVRDVRPLRHHRGSRCVIEVSTDVGRFALKAFRRDPAERAATLTRLALGGLARPRGPSVTVLAGYHSRLACLVLEWLEGEPAVALMALGEGRRVGELAAQWLAAAATVSPDGLEHYDHVEMLTDLDRWCGVISSADRTLGRRSSEVVRRLCEEAPPGGREGLLQLSFSVNHLVDLGEGPGVLDWDDPRHGPLELDAGAYLASLVRHLSQHPERSSATAAAATALLVGTNQLLDPVALAWYRRSALVKQAKHACKLQTRGWLSLADALLDESDWDGDGGGRA